MSSEIVTVWESISKEDADKLTDDRKERDSLFQTVLNLL